MDQQSRKRGPKKLAFALLGFSIAIAVLIWWTRQSAQPDFVEPAAPLGEVASIGLPGIEEAAPARESVVLADVPIAPAEPAASIPEESFWRIFGTVHSEGGVPIAGATIEGFRGKGFNTVTDEIGAYELRPTSLSDMRHIVALLAEHPHYLPERKDTNL